MVRQLKPKRFPMSNFKTTKTMFVKFRFLLES